MKQTPITSNATQSSAAAHILPTTDVQNTAYYVTHFNWNLYIQMAVTATHCTGVFLHLWQILLCWLLW